MFKKVEYVGFEDKPELKSWAEYLTSLLAGEMNTWREDVEVRWSPHPDPVVGTLDLKLSLALPNGVTATRGGTFTYHDSGQESWLAARCRRVWSGLLGELIESLDARVQEFVLETAEA